MKKRAGYKLIALLLCFVLSVCGITAALTVGAIRFVYPMKYEDYIDKYSAQYDVPKTLLFAVIKTESSFDPKAESSAGALGLTQITPETFHWLQTKTGETLSDDALSDPETAIRYGALFLGLLLDEFNSAETAVAAYHAGRGRVNSWLKDENISPDVVNLKDIPIPETAHYVRKVMRAVNIYNSLYKSR